MTRALALLALGLGVAGCAAPPARVAGRVVIDGDPLPAATVVLRSREDGREVQAVTDADGVYRLPGVPAGEYRVEARSGQGARLGALTGRNPLHLPPGAEVWLGLQAVPHEEPRFRSLAGSSAGAGALAGVVRHGGRPVEGAVVELYLDDAEGFRGQGVRQSFPTAADGAYALDEVAEGAYHAVARRRAGGATAGPVREGDLYGIALANPIPVRAGTETVLDLHVVRKERADDPNEDLLALHRTGLRGRVVEASGAPAAGVYVFAYRDRIVGHRKPDFLTLPTGPDGSFVLPLGTGGLFYVGARERSGGSPQPGERFGFYEGSPDHGVVVPRGRVQDGVEITVRRVLE
ncbi:MAG: carboxypeptidase regulatory-like domain-containing protein [Deferrisomatales bacterium]